MRLLNLLHLPLLRHFNDPAMMRAIETAPAETPDPVWVRVVPWVILALAIAASIVFELTKGDTDA